MKRYPVYKDSYIEWIVASDICRTEYLDSVRGNKGIKVQVQEK